MSEQQSPVSGQQSPVSGQQSPVSGQPSSTGGQGPLAPWTSALLICSCCSSKLVLLSPILLAWELEFPPGHLSSVSLCVWSLWTAVPAHSKYSGARMDCAHRQALVQSPLRLRKRECAGPGDVALRSVALLLIDLKRQAVKCQLSLKGVESVVGGREVALASAVTRLNGTTARWPDLDLERCQVSNPRSDPLWSMCLGIDRHGCGGFSPLSPL